MNLIKIIGKVLGWLGRAAGLKPGPDVKPLERKRPVTCALCWRYDLTARAHPVGEPCPNEWRRGQDWT